MHQIEHDLSDAQVRQIAIAAGLLIVVALVLMYRQFQSMKLRYPQTVGGPEPLRAKAS